MDESGGGTFRERLEAVERRVAAACARSGRDPSEVTLVAVAKTFGPEDVAEAAACGVRVIGENRVQEARQKIPLCPGGLEWHFIGHLQRNKVREAVALFQALHAVDSSRLLDAVEEAAADAGVRIPVCLEVNVAGESSKFGVRPDELPDVVERGGALPHVGVVGLMTVPPFVKDPQDARRHFAALRELRDRCRASTGLELTELSMGMTHDFEIAVEEGATWVRLGTILFGDRRRPERQIEEL